MSFVGLARLTGMTEPKTHTLDVPGAVLQYDVRANEASTEPVLLLIGSPMDAGGFVTLAGHFPDRTVVTYDPRGAGRSPRTDGASSGGAVNALALVAKHPEQVRTLLAHEPPASQELPDREPILAACDDIHQTYQRSGFGPAMAKFIVLVSYRGPLSVDYAQQPAPDPAMFGLPGEDDGSRNHPLVGQNIVTGRAAVAVAERLGTAPVTFPGGHDGFLGGEYGSAGEPDAFAATLRTVLAG